MALLTVLMKVFEVAERSGSLMGCTDLSGAYRFVDWAQLLEAFRNVQGTGMGHNCGIHRRACKLPQESAFKGTDSLRGLIF